MFIFKRLLENFDIIEVTRYHLDDTTAAIKEVAINLKFSKNKIPSFQHLKQAKVAKLPTLVSFLPS